MPFASCGLARLARLAACCCGVGGGAPEPEPEPSASAFASAFLVVFSGFLATNKPSKAFLETPL